jgi:Xaa-Pro aminopeptidase
MPPEPKLTSQSPPILFFGETFMTRYHDDHRMKLNRQALLGAKLDALVCALPSNVMLLSGYRPVVGTGIVIATPTSITLVVPSDEEELANAGCAGDVRTFNDGSLTKLESLTDAVRPVLGDALRSLNLHHGSIGYEHGPWIQPPPYVAVNSYGAAMPLLLSDLMPDAKLMSADHLLKGLRLVKTPHEIGHLRTACRIAGAAFTDGIGHVRRGRTETQVAAIFQGGLLQSHDDDRAAGSCFCMAGPNAALAYKAYQRSSQRELRTGDLALVHCNSTAGGFWTDITRTYCVGSPTLHQRQLYEAVFAARHAALNSIRPGIPGSVVDHAARSVLKDHGFGPNFKHPTGHGVGFDAIDHNASPRLHPLSNDALEIGMVFNVEPAIYIEGECGLRHCDMVAVTGDGHELLTPFQDRPDQLVIQ